MHFACSFCSSQQALRPNPIEQFRQSDFYHGLWQFLFSDDSCKGIERAVDFRDGFSEIGINWPDTVWRIPAAGNCATGGCPI